MEESAAQHTNTCLDFFVCYCCLGGGGGFFDRSSPSVHNLLTANFF